MTDGSALQTNVCPVCGIHYAAPTAFFQARRTLSASKTGWWCPNGHNLVFTETEVDRERRRAQQAEQRIAQLQDELAGERRRADKEAMELTRVRKRLARGVCPCCNRTFDNLARHMATKHPEKDQRTCQPISRPPKRSRSCAAS